MGELTERSTAEECERPTDTDEPGAGGACEPVCKGFDAFEAADDEEGVSADRGHAVACCGVAKSRGTFSLVQSTCRLHAGSLRDRSPVPHFGPAPSSRKRQSRHLDRMETPRMR